MSDIGYFAGPSVAKGVLLTARRWLGLALNHLPADIDSLTLRQFMDHLEEASTDPDAYRGVVNDQDVYLTSKP